MKNLILCLALLLVLSGCAEATAAQSNYPQPSFTPNLRIGHQNYHYACSGYRSGCTVTVFEVIDCEHGVIMYSDSWNNMPSAVSVGRDAVKEICQ